MARDLSFSVKTRLHQSPVDHIWAGTSDPAPTANVPNGADDAGDKVPGPLPVVSEPAFDTSVVATFHGSEVFDLEAATAQAGRSPGRIRPCYAQ